MKSYVIHFIRHGMTQANLNGQYAGSWDVPLCEKGKEKLKEIKERYDYPYVEEIYTSPLSRCKDTCGIIYNNSIPIVVEGFKECSFGDWEGKTTEELTSNPDYLNWIKGVGDVITPNGESWKMFFERVCKSFENVVLSLMKRGVTTAAIFTHGGVIMTILSKYGIPKAPFYDWIVDNGCGYSVRITPGLWMRDKVLEVYDKVPLGASGEIEGKFKSLIDNLK